tara:strand:+ start:539 stop:760 length:222 start_codon:yes stop_codon:yes gene_type:complete
MYKLTKFERVRVIGARATQLSLGAPSTIDTTNMIDVLKIAEEELRQKNIPITIKRTYPNGEVKEIPVSDMIIE